MLGVKIHTDALAVIWCNAGTGHISHFLCHTLQHSGAVGLKICPQKRKTHFFAFGGFAQAGNHLVQPVAAAQFYQQFYHQVCAVIHEIVFLQRAVAACLQAYGLVDNIAVAALEAVMHTALLCNKLGKAGAGDRICHNGGAGVVAQQNCAHQRNQAVAVQLFAIGQHGPGPVYICVKNNAKVCLFLQHGLPDAGHGGFILWVWNMVREHAVRLQIAAARDVCPQRCQHLFGKKAARAVAGVHHNMKPCQWVQIIFGLYAIANQRNKVPGIDAHEILLLHRLGRGLWRLCGHLLRLGKNGFDVAAFQPARGGEKFQTVAVVGQMAGRHHHCAVKRLRAQHGAHEHGGGAGQ